MYFGINNYPELRNLGNIDRERILKEFKQAYPRQVQFAQIPLIIVIAGTIPLLKTINQSIFGSNSVLLSALTGGVIGAVAAVIIHPLMNTFYLRKYFLKFLNETKVG
jgi:hypothetical protein